MRDQSRTDQKLIDEISVLKQRVKELGQSESEYKHAEQEIALLAEIGRVVGSTLDLNQVYERVAIETRKLIPYNRLLVNRKITQDGQFIVAFASGIDNPKRRKGDLYPRQGSATGVVMATRKGILIQPDDAEEIKDLYPNLYETFKTGLRSTMSVPLISMDEVIGSMNFRSEKLKAYTEQDLRLAERIGAQIAEAIANAQLYSDLSKTEKSLRESEIRYRQLVEHAPAAIYELDLTTGRFLSVNEVLCEYSGYTRDELLALNPMDLMTEEGQKLMLQRMAAYAAGEPVSPTVEYKARTKSGREFWISVNAKYFYQGGIPVRATIVAYDITERKQAEEKLIYIMKAVESAGDAIGISDSLGHHFYQNKALSDLFGYDTAEELEAAGGGHVVVKDPKVAKEMFNSIMGGKSWVGELEMVTKSGHVFPAFERADAIKDNEGNLIGLIGIITDITDRKRAEEQLQETVESLRKSMSATIQVMVSTVEARDPYTAGHQARSANLARAIATEMGLSQEKIEGIRMAGTIHDIGKISIPAEILSKPVRLSEIEFALIKAHAQRGFEMLKDVESPWPLAEIVYQHHERMDGSGYPRNLKGDEICMEARILSVADVVEAMASHRPYRPGLGIDAALNEIEKNSGVFYDTEVADACLKLFREEGFKLEGGLSLG